MKKADFRLEETIISLQDLKSLILEVRDYAKWFTHDSIKKRVGVKKGRASPPAMSPATETVIRQWNAKKPLSQQSLDELIATLEDYAKTAPQFTVVLAAPPTITFKKTIVGWCRDNVAPNILVNFQFNSTLLGGIVVRCGSRVYDWSFRRQILDSGQKFAEVLRRV